MVMPCLVQLNDLIVYFVLTNFSHFRSNFFKFQAIFVQLLGIFRAQFQYFRSTICRSLVPIDQQMYQLMQQQINYLTFLPAIQNLNSYDFQVFNLPTVYLLSKCWTNMINDFQLFDLPICHPDPELMIFTAII